MNLKSRPIHMVSKPVEHQAPSYTIAGAVRDAWSSKIRSGQGALEQQRSVECKYVVVYLDI